MVLTKMYGSEQIVIPDKVSNLLKVYAKAALKTQPYDLLKWSAAYFRCLSMNVSPPVKSRYEKDDAFGSLTRGLLKMLLNQVGKGYYIERPVLEHFWHGLCLPEDELLKFLSLTRMLYWTKIHWLKLLAVMVGSINRNFHETIYNLCEILSDEPEGGSAAVPLWVFREFYTYLAELDCSQDQTFFDGRKTLSNRELEDEVRPATVPRKVPSATFRNTMIDYWKYRTENLDKRKLLKEIEVTEKADDDTEKPVSIEELLKEDPEIEPNFQLVGDISDPKDIIKKADNFDSVLEVFQQLKFDANFQQDAEKERRIEELKIKLMEDAIKNHFGEQTSSVYKDLCPPWNWLNSFASHSARDRSYNFLEPKDPDAPESDDEDFEAHIGSRKASAATIKSASTTISNITFEDIEESAAMNPHKVLIDSICSISEQSEHENFDIQDNNAIKEALAQQHSNRILSASDYNRLRGYIEKADAKGINFKDLNDLYNYFIQESSNEKFSDVIEIREEDEDEVDNGSENSENPDSAGQERNDKMVSIFRESGIEVDGKLLDAVSERMILGLVDKPIIEDNVSDVTSVSSSSQAETVKENKAVVSKDQDAQTIPYLEQCRDRYSSKKSASGKSKSAIKREPFTCKFPPLPGIGATVKPETIESFLTYVTQRAFEQNGLVYPRNFNEDECPLMYDDFGEE